jgi:hypothetical protein
VHQRLHIDNADILGTDFLEQVLEGEFKSITDKDWLVGGYFVDAPLSKEGSWLRIAVPDPENKKFVVDYVFVPFGSFLVRSGALFHSGHYGHPGNTRVHGIVMLNDQTSNSNQLGFLETVTTSKGWTTEWAKGIQYRPKPDEKKPERNFELAENVMHYCTKEIKNRRRSGTMYLNLLKENMYTGFPVRFWMLNPYLGCPKYIIDDSGPLPPADDEEEDGDGDDDANEGDDDGDAGDDGPPPRKRKATKKKGAPPKTKRAGRKKTG